MNKKTVLIVTAFTAAAAIASGLPDNIYTYFTANQGDNDKLQPQKLIDENGQAYTLTQNDNGTETATYDNGQSVDFERDEDNNIHYLSGTSGLLAGLAASYFFYHGLNNGGLYYDRNKQDNGTVSSSHVYNAGSRNSGVKSVSPETGHSGFGSEGARSAGS